jgi:hypothetical protein
MASFLDSLGQSLTPQTMNTIGSALGLDQQMVQQGLDVVGPLVGGGLASSASTPQGLDSLMQILQPPADGAPATGLGSLLAGLDDAGGAGSGGGLLGGILSMFGGGGGGGSSDVLGSLLSAATGAGGQAGGAGDLTGALLNGLFGAGAIPAIGAQLDKALGFKVSPLLVLVAPFVLKQLQKAMTEQKLDANGVASLLQEQNQRFMADGGQNAQIVQQAMAAGQQAAALRAQFSAEEWMKVRLAPTAAAGLVMAADASGPIGAVQEVAAGMQALAQAREAADPTSLLTVAFDGSLSEAEKNLMTEATTKEHLVAAIKEATGLVASKAPGDLAAYRQAILAVATATSEAAAEGGFLGFGGAKVSDAERAALAEVSAAVNG